jgi:hypothetical protein
MAFPGPYDFSLRVIEAIQGRLIRNLQSPKMRPRLLHMALLVHPCDTRSFGAGVDHWVEDGFVVILNDAQYGDYTQVYSS